MTFPLISPERQAAEERGGRPQDPNRAQGAGTLHMRDRHGTYKAPAKPGPNEPCECASGRKAKKCHPKGLEARVNRVEKAEPGSVCDGCGKPTDLLVPLRHDGLEGVIANLGSCCLSGDPRPVFDRILAKAKNRPAPSAPVGGAA